MSIARVKFTKSFVDRLPLVQPGDSAPQRIYHDSEVSSLRLTVGRQTKAFAYSGRVRGTAKRKLIQIAHHGEHENGVPITIDEVRRRALDIKRRLRQGEDVPTVKESAEARRRDTERAKETERANLPERVTFGDAWTIYRTEMEKKGRSRTTIADYELRIRVHLGDWLDRTLVEIGRDTAGVVARHAELSVARARPGAATPSKASNAGGAATSHREPKGKLLPNGERRTPQRGGKAAANATMRVFRAVYNRGARIYGRDNFPPNPVTEAVEFNRLKPRKSALPQTVLRDWYEGILQLRNPVLRDYYLLLLFTGLRRTSAAEIRWEHVDFEKGRLRIPKPKGGEDRAFTLPISAPMREILERRRNGGRCEGALVAEDPGNDLLAPGSEFVFPGRMAEKRSHLKDVRMPDDFPVEFTPHALRHTFNSTAIAAGVSRDYIKVLMNHAQQATDMTEGYFTAEWRETCKAQRKVTAKILTALGRKR